MASPGSSSGPPPRRHRADSPVDDMPCTTQLPVDLTPPPFAKPSIIPPRPLRKPLPRMRIFKPAKGSIHDIMRQNPRASLFTRPSCWTDLHTELLGASFNKLPSCDTPVPINEPGSLPSRGHLRPSTAIRTLSHALTEILLATSICPDLSPGAITSVLSTLWPAAFAHKPKTSPELNLFFGKRVYRDVRRPLLLWSRPATGAAPGVAPDQGVASPTKESPMLCYVNRDSLLRMRSNLFRLTPRPGRSLNEPVHRLHLARSKTLMPANPEHDVQFVALILAMAQRHFYAQPPPSPRSRFSGGSSERGPTWRPDFQDIKLRVMTHDMETAEFILYTALVKAEFLDRFHQPYDAPLIDGSVPGLDIEYTRIPIWPILGLRERLGKALGEDIVGRFDPTVMETWDHDADVESAAAQAYAKRKRDALSAVLNGSFDEATDDESERLVKSRCLGKGSRVGVVA